MKTSSPALLLRKEKGVASSFPLLTKERLGEVSKHVVKTLQSHSDAPELDAQRILLHALGKDDASYLLAHGDEIVSDQKLKTILEMAEKRKTGMPLAYILGHADFYGRTFIVTPDVLIPRPDTELLIDKALGYIKNCHAGLDPVSRHVDSGSEAGMTVVIADVCTGSGIIAITLALELPHAHIIATDISPAALEIAKQNAEKYGVLDKIEFIQGEMLAPIGNKKIDLIVSNPPYIPTSELALWSALKTGEGKIEKIGLDFEPFIALDGGEDGLKFVNQITEFSQANNIPAIIETVGGEIITPNKKGE